MNGDDRLERRLKEFYDQVPDIEDALPFKDYLIKHEDSRMAWYLLGKQYESKGQEAKARYCFGQAGEIYEAFENKTAPVTPNGTMTGPLSKRRSRRLLAAGGAALLVAAGVLFYAGQAAAPDRERKPSESAALPAAEAEAGTADEASAEPGVPSPAGNRSGAGYDLIAGAAEPDGEGSRIFAQLAARTGKSDSLLIRSPRIGQWTDWVRAGTPVASLSAGTAPGSAVLLWHDPKWCACQASDGNEAMHAVEAWKPAQEAKLLLRSAMESYRSRTGRWPAEPESLAGAYPDNTVAGWTDEMTQWFDELKGVLDNKKDGKIPTTAGWPERPAPGSPSGTPAGQLAPLVAEPMQILVDKTNHRLAVVSGNVLVRNYAVGLGGDKTPEGRFVISEKVRDPNGKPAGVFGSRGMTLSDTRYGIHGTNEPDSIGKDESQGCIRMAKDDIEELYDLVPMGTPVTITKGGLPSETRVPAKRFRLPAAQDETNPRKIYDWLN
ncbi:L,D-transpeptidase family protein [Cohnella sp. CFH 77786]|uniref:L,D-transpeptidase n=1 Tax=Cohnella sp. CFH 77786 TaxID=2662265 RepID=UPI001C60AAEF|nr:L,D-transpeptidase [Cohnella sp. CFH 77786]MBW5445107.1 L,D-transpeptidase family protein [Cohnella sp. CFH 77786]